MIMLAAGENAWGDLASLFGVGILTGLSPWLFALKGLPWFPKLPPGAANAGDGTARLVFTAAASICCGWVYIIFVSLPPVHFLVRHRGMVALSTSFVALLVYVILWLWLSAIETRNPPPEPPAKVQAWDRSRSALFVVAFGSYVLMFTSLAISVSVATAFQENYLVEGQVEDANKKADIEPKPVAEAIVQAQTMDGSDIDETETNSCGSFLLVVPRTKIEAQAINVMATLQKNHVPTSEQKTQQIFLRGWNRARIIFNPPTGSIVATPAPTSQQSPKSSPTHP